MWDSGPHTGNRPPYGSVDLRSTRVDRRSTLHQPVQPPISCHTVQAPRGKGRLVLSIRQVREPDGKPSTAHYALPRRHLRPVKPFAHGSPVRRTAWTRRPCPLWAHSGQTLLRAPLCCLPISAFRSTPSTFVSFRAFRGFSSLLALAVNSSSPCIPSILPPAMSAVLPLWFSSTPQKNPAHLAADRVFEEVVELLRGNRSRSGSRSRGAWAAGSGGEGDSCCGDEEFNGFHDIFGCVGFSASARLRRKSPS